MIYLYFATHLNSVGFLLYGPCLSRSHTRMDHKVLRSNRSKHFSILKSSHKFIIFSTSKSKHYKSKINSR